MNGINLGLLKIDLNPLSKVEWAYKWMSSENSSVHKFKFIVLIWLSSPQKGQNYAYCLNLYIHFPKILNKLWWRLQTLLLQDQGLFS